MVPNAVSKPGETLKFLKKDLTVTSEGLAMFTGYFCLLTTMQSAELSVQQATKFRGAIGSLLYVSPDHPMLSSQNASFTSMALMHQSGFDVNKRGITLHAAGFVAGPYTSERRGSQIRNALHRSLARLFQALSLKRQSSIVHEPRAQQLCTMWEVICFNQHLRSYEPGNLIGLSPEATTSSWSGSSSGGP